LYNLNAADAGHCSISWWSDSAAVSADVFSDRCWRVSGSFEKFASAVAEKASEGQPENCDKIVASCSDYAAVEATAISNALAIGIAPKTGATIVKYWKVLYRGSSYS
jgi:hypothetical protein